MPQIPRAKRTIGEGQPRLLRTSADTSVEQATAGLGRTISGISEQVQRAEAEIRDRDDNLAAYEASSNFRIDMATYGNQRLRNMEGLDAKAVMAEHRAASKEFLDRHGEKLSPEQKEKYMSLVTGYVNQWTDTFANQSYIQNQKRIDKQSKNIVDLAEMDVANFKSSDALLTALVDIESGILTLNEGAAVPKTQDEIQLEILNAKDRLIRKYFVTQAQNPYVDTDDVIKSVEANESIVLSNGTELEWSVVDKKALLADLRTVKATEDKRAEEAAEEAKGLGYKNIINDTYNTPSDLHNSAEYRLLDGDAPRQKFLDDLYNARNKWKKETIDTTKKNASNAEYAKLVTLMAEQGYDAISEQNMLDLTKTGNLTFDDYEEAVKTRDKLKDKQIGPQLKLKLTQAKKELELLRDAKAFDSSDKANNESMYNNALMQATTLLTENPRADITPIIDEVKKHMDVSLIDRIYFNFNRGAISEGLVSASSGAEPIEREIPGLKDIKKPEDLMDLFKQEVAEQRAVKATKDTAFRQRLFATKALELNNAERIAKGQKPLAINEKNIQAVVARMLKTTEE